MARHDLVALGGSSLGEDVGVFMHSSSGLLLLSMIVFFLSIISMVIFACGERPGTAETRCPCCGGGGGCGSGCGGG
ncbi:hypothetical protein PTKIN_Ptkin15bG0136200 [Pterospermum kingtungense]